MLSCSVLLSNFVRKNSRINMLTDFKSFSKLLGVTRPILASLLTSSHAHLRLQAALNPNCREAHCCHSVIKIIYLVC